MNFIKNKKVFILCIIIFISIIFYVGYIFYTKNNIKEISQSTQTNNIQNLTDTETSNLNIDYFQDSKSTNLAPQEPKTTKPKIVLIIDDVSNTKEYKKISSIGLKLNPSFFPRQEASPHTPEIAKNAPFFLVHLPLQANNFYQKGVKYINIGASTEYIQNYISEIKKDFPQVRYINNHTGSAYTASRKDMKELITILKSHDIKFLDSKTTPKSVAKDYVDGIYLFRNVFLDNIEDEKYIANQLKKAFKFADKYGFVIVIAHPKNKSIKVLRQYASFMNDKYELIYLDELDEMLSKFKKNHNKG